jgi:hypothetical protein
MKANSRNRLEGAILHLLENENASNLPEATSNLPEIVRELRSLADEASIKAALLKLNSEGLVQITPDWKFRSAAAVAASR